MFLLDANVLIALGDSAHVHHTRVQSWFHSRPARAWATCPLTENAFLRIIGSSAYPAQVSDPHVLRSQLQRMCAYPGHQFWDDAVSLCDSKRFPRLTASKHQTDLYLLGLAIARKGKLATLDQRIDPKLIPGGVAAYYVLP